MHFKQIFPIILLTIAFSQCNTASGMVYELNGKNTSKQVNLIVATLAGSGTIESNDIVIDCDEFKFTGTIQCEGQCLINAKKAFSHRMFTRKGNGRFIINSPFDVVGFLWKAALVAGVAAAGYHFFVKKENKQEKKHANLHAMKGQ